MLYPSKKGTGPPIIRNGKQASSPVQTAWRTLPHRQQFIINKEYCTVLTLFPPVVWSRASFCSCWIYYQSNLSLAFSFAPFPFFKKPCGTTCLTQATSTHHWILFCLCTAAAICTWIVLCGQESATANGCYSTKQQNIQSFVNRGPVTHQCAKPWQKCRNIFLCKSNFCFLYILMLCDRN